MTMIERIISFTILPILPDEEVVCNCNKHISDDDAYVVTFFGGLSVYIRCIDCIRILLREREL